MGGLSNRPSNGQRSRSGGGKKKKRISSAYKSSENKENQPPPEPKRQRKRNDHVADLDQGQKALRKTMIVSIANQVRDERRKFGKADIMSKINNWNKSVSHEGLKLTKPTITSEINNQKRREEKEAQATAAAAATAAATATLPSAPRQASPPLPPPPPPPPSSSSILQSSSSASAGAGAAEAGSLPSGSSNATNDSNAGPVQSPHLLPVPENLPLNWTRCAAGRWCACTHPDLDFPGFAPPTHRCTKCNRNLHTQCGNPSDTPKGMHTHDCPSCAKGSAAEATSTESDTTPDPNDSTAPDSALDSNDSTAPDSALDSNDSTAPDSALDSNDATAPDSALDSNDTAAPKSTKNKGGRPKGSTKEAQRALENATKEAKNWVVREHAAARKRLQDDPSGKTQLPKGFLGGLIDQAKERWNLKELKVPKQTVSNREKSGSLDVYHPGTESPMAPVERTLLEYIIAAHRMNAPLDKPTVIQIANDLIQKTEHEERVRAFKVKRAHVESDDEIEELLGDAWYRGFLRRYAHIIKPKKRKMFAVNRANSTKYEDFETMYDTMDEVIVLSGNGHLLETPVFMDINGNITEDETRAIGHAVKAKLTDPDNVIYGDEVGDNTNMKDDGHIGGKLYLTPTNENAKILAAIQNSHFTVVGFTSGSGKPVMIVIIFKAATVHPKWKLGLDIFSTEEGVGEGKIHPGGPTCVFKGVEVPVYCNSSESGSMTSEILADAFKTMDDLKLFTRGPNGKAPVAMLDGHCSRLGLPFLDYVLNEETKWYVLLGVPNQTQIWQLGDSAEQNGCYKISLYKWKVNLLMKKQGCQGIPLCILKEEVAWGVRVACEASFFRVLHNIRAMARRGLGITMNRACLDLPEVLRTASTAVQAARNEVLARRGQATSSSGVRAPVSVCQGPSAVADPSTLNLNNGLAGEYLGRIIDNYDRQGGAEAHEKRKKVAENALKNLRDHTRITAGAVVSSKDGGHLIKEGVRTEVRHRRDVNEEKVSERKRKSLEKKKELKAKVDKIRRSSKYKRIVRSAAWKNDKDLAKLLNDRKLGLTNPVLKTLCQWKKNSADGKIPTSKPDLIKRFIKTRAREEPLLLTDREADVNSDSDNADRSNDVSSAEGPESSKGASENDDDINEGEDVIEKDNQGDEDDESTGYFSVDSDEADDGDDNNSDEDESESEEQSDDDDESENVGQRTPPRQFTRTSRTRSRRGGQR